MKIILISINEIRGKVNDNFQFIMDENKLTIICLIMGITSRNVGTIFTRDNHQGYF